MAEIGNYRWRILALLFFATTINYIDRQVIGILAPVLQTEIGWNEIDYSRIVMAFQIAYAIGMASTGYFLDRFGTRIGFAVAIVVWSLAGIGHALARSVAGFALARFVLGIGEAANFPACLKTVSEWFPQKERALATGIFNSGSNIGAILAPLTVPFIATQYGWQWAFIITGAVGFIWLIFWWQMYTKPELHPVLSQGELAYIQSGNQAAAAPVRWGQLLAFRQTWALCLMRFITDPVWWFFLFWVPKFLYAQYGLQLQALGLPLIVLFLVADVGSISGGWLSSFWLKRGRSLDFARRNTLLVCALLAMPVALAAQMPSAAGAVALVALAAAAYQGWSANIFTIVTDLYPKNAVASMSGLAGMSGAIGGTLFSSLIGYVLETTGNYALIFGGAGFVFISAWLLLRILLPSLQVVKYE
ncbi:MFS transporter [Rhodoflexus caldus]|uniref:MFS transporter n=1 Tax=Rhodoflexus caldus TaxID=2891236 RepID=UPI00202AA016|nr:MFS transporter [Rhodoflexus caldus]